MIGFLNLAVVGLILSTFTTRFVYPMISLEGRRFWILGLLPVHRDQIVWSKFLFSFLGGVVPCTRLVLLSDSMLGLPWRLIAVHEFCCLHALPRPLGDRGRPGCPDARSPRIVAVQNRLRASAARSAWCSVRCSSSAW